MIRLRRRLPVWLPPLVVLAAMLAYSGYYLTTPGEQFSRFHEDDTHYYTAIARNLYAGHPFTFDGLNRTNGFHPLWVGVITPLFAFSDSDAMVTRICFILSYILFAGSAVVLYYILIRITKHVLVSFAFALIFAVEPHFYKMIITGLETPLFIFLLLLCLLLYIRAEQRPTRGGIHTLVLGLAIGLLMLARLDGGLFIASSLFLVFAWRRWREKRFGVIAIYVLSTIALPGSYLLASYHFTGGVVPVSGMMKAMRASSPSQPVQRGFLCAIDVPNLYNFKSPAFEKLITVPLFKRSLDTDGWDYKPYANSSVYLVIISSVVLLGVYIVYLLMRRGQADTHGTYVTATALASLALIVFSKANYSCGVLIYYYAAPLSIVQIILLGYILGNLRIERGHMGTFFSAALACYVLVVAVKVHDARASYFRNGTGYKYWCDIAQWLRQNTHGDVRVAAFNAGIVGYYSQRHVINLDGKVNSYAFLKDVRRPWLDRASDRYDIMLNYLRDNDITYFADRFLYSQPQHIFPPESLIAQEITLELVFETQEYGGNRCGRVYAIKYNNPNETQMKYRKGSFKAEE